MRAALILAGALSLAGCGQVVSTPVASDGRMVARIANGNGYVVDTFCDGGRAVYVYDGYRSGGIAVIDNAPECRRPAGVRG